MSNKINMIKTVRGINSYGNVIDTEFTELVTPVVETIETDVTVEEFFDLYERLFFDIPPEGDVNSHSYLVTRSREYIGGSLVDPEKLALIEEINSLRQQLLDINQTIFNVDKLSR
jgi:hypothetical protein